MVSAPLEVSPVPRAFPSEMGGDVCQACGACCAYSREWPRFSLETDEEIARIPSALVAENLNGMRCDGDRCLALAGDIGTATRCTIYAARPQVCRSCMPGDDACVMARTHFQLYDMPRGSTPETDEASALQPPSQQPPARTPKETTR